MIFNSHWGRWIELYGFQFTWKTTKKILWFSIHMNKPWINLTRFWDCSWCTLLESLALQLTCCCGDDIDWQLSADLIRGDGAAVFAPPGQLGTWVCALTCETFCIGSLNHLYICWGLVMSSGNYIVCLFLWPALSCLDDDSEMQKAASIISVTAGSVNAHHNIKSSYLSQQWTLIRKCKQLRRESNFDRKCY